ncbi:hypothetical protein FQN57_002688 [Myotisia sp. PD_48]|nr:hypothetical protein FQN57_002688 [Myotisia sp. PD_48]
MKQRYSSLDVKAISRELASSVIGLRISNIYDLSPRTFLFKLALPDIRKQLVIDSGFRCHLTDYTRTIPDTPSVFVSRLRKFLKTRRITAVRQIGTDRILEFEISDGQFHLFLEFFAAGNLILTNEKYDIVALLRHVPLGPDVEEVRPGLNYRLDNKMNYTGVPLLSLDRLMEVLQKTASPSKNAKKKTENLKRTLYFGFPEFPPPLLDHAFHAVGFDSSLQPPQVLSDKRLIESLMLVLQEAHRVDENLSTMDSLLGYIVARKKFPGTQEVEEAQQPELEYREFHPFEPSQFKDVSDTTILQIDGFNKAVDQYFSSVEARKLESRITEREDTLRRKLDASKRDHERRVGALKEIQELHTRKAQAIEANLQHVEDAMTAVNGLIGQGMDWVEIARLIEMEQSKNNPVAKIIKLPLKLYENTITVALGETGAADEAEWSESEDADSDDEDFYRPKAAEAPKQELLTIDIDLGISPWANCRQYYDQKKSAAVKEEKTLRASKKALKSTERKLKSDLKQGLKHEKPVLRQARTPAWFEKFYFFISSDGFLILGGKDDRQRDILYQRYLRKGDIFVHADMEGAVPLIIKNRSTDTTIPPTTLAQAGTFSIATSKAWDSKAVVGAWWVNADQVSKLTPMGDILKAGDVLINGEKNHLAPSQIILGFAVLFQVSPESPSSANKFQLHGEGRDGQGQSAVDDNKDAEATPSLKDIEVPHDMDDDDENMEHLTDTLQATRVEEDMELESEIESTMPSTEQHAHYHKADAEGPDGGQSAELPPSSVGQPSKPSTRASGVPQEIQKAKQNIRGKRGKAKKAATKYKDQDEEDRELALSLLGSKGDQIPKTQTTAEVVANMEAIKERRKAQHDRALEAERRRLEEFSRDGKGPDGQDSEAAFKMDLASLSSLVGSPMERDEIIAALPVCAPWSAVSQYKYRSKLQPGPIKKGKIVREVLGKWIHDASAAIARDNKSTASSAPVDTPDQGLGPDQEGEGVAVEEGARNELAAMELELIKGWRIVEVINTLPVGSLKIVSISGVGTTSAGGGRGAGTKENIKTKKSGGAKVGKGGKKK